MKDMESKSLLEAIKEVIGKYESKPDWPKFKVGSKVRFIWNNEVRSGYVYSAMICGNETHYTLGEPMPLMHIQLNPEHYRTERELAHADRRHHLCRQIFSLS